VYEIYNYREIKLLGRMGKSKKPSFINEFRHSVAGYEVFCDRNAGRANEAPKKN